MTTRLDNLMFRFTIRDLLWLAVVVAVLSNGCSAQPSAPESSPAVFIC